MLHEWDAVVVGAGIVGLAVGGELARRGARTAIFEERTAGSGATQASAGVLAPHIRTGHVAIASINSPMQCMMKEICAQCLQKHVDPATGREEFIFSCFNQDQEMDRVDFPNLNMRLRQNTVQEKLSNRWLDHLLATVDLPHV